MTRRRVTDEQYGLLHRRLGEVARRVDEGTIPFEPTMSGLQIIIGGKSLNRDAVANTRTLAKDILGRDFISIGQAEKHFGVRFTGREKRTLAEIPFSEAELTVCAGDYILFPGYPLSIMDIHDKASNRFYTRRGPWYGEEGQRFAQEDKIDVGWYMVRKDVIPGSLNRSTQDQLAMIPKDEENTRPNELVFGIVLYHLVTGVWLLPNIYARCNGFSLHGRRVDVGNSAHHCGVALGNWSDEPVSSLGVSARKSRTLSS